MNNDTNGKQERRIRNKQNLAKIKTSKELDKNEQFTPEMISEIENYFNLKFDEIKKNISTGSKKKEYLLIWEKEKISMRLYNHLHHPFEIEITLDKIKTLTVQDYNRMGAKFICNCIIISWFEKLHEIGKSLLDNSINENVEVDNRIKGKLKKNEIEKYFMDAFSEKQDDQKPLLSEQQIKDFLCANFIDFTTRKEVEKFNTSINIQGRLRRIIYQFHLKHNTTNRTKQYVNLLLTNFSAFDNTSFEVERRNFSK